jgi:hypothetical protein
LENVITTGVSVSAVEAMEAELRKDVLRELKRTGGRVLLHDEVEEDGDFIITATWEEINPEECVLVSFCHSPPSSGLSSVAPARPRPLVALELTSTLLFFTTVS